MKAAICTKYGAPEVLQIKNIEKPTPKDNEILVRIMASAVNSADIRVRSLNVKCFPKIIMRIVLGFEKPRKPILGVVFSGIVEETGGQVRNFDVGNEIFGLTGSKFGAHAEYITLPDRCIAIKKPVNATFEEAAAIPFGGHTAIYFLKKASISKRISPKVLIYGSTGSVGAAAIQIAKHHNALITAVCSQAGIPLAKELGAISVIPYDKEDFTKRAEKFDIIFDTVGKISKKQCSNLLADNGCFVTVGGFEAAVERKEQLVLLRELFENGEYKAVVDKTYTLEEVIEAHKYVDKGHKKGNVVIGV